MGASGAGASQGPGTISGRGRTLRRWAVLLVGVVAAVTQVHATQAQVPPVHSIFQARICQALLVVRADFGANDFVRQALAPFLARFGCTPTTTTIASNTTTSTHLDCQLPGGGIGPCPTTTVVTIPPTTFPPGTFPTSSTTSTIPPCPSTTTTTIFMPTTTIPCQPIGVVT